MPFYDGVVGGRSVGVPGTVRMLELAYQDHGKLAWADLFQRQIEAWQLNTPSQEEVETTLDGYAELAQMPVVMH